MPAYEPNLPARQVHARFTRTLEEAESVRRNLVLWFADLYRRKLYLELGYTSVYAYTAQRHGFSKSRCTQFIRLAESLSRLPVLRDALEAGEMPWTKAREVVKVATPRTERAWVAEARCSSRRVLERKVVEARERARTDRGTTRNQGSLGLAAEATTGSPDPRGLPVAPGSSPISTAAAEVGSTATAAEAQAKASEGTAFRPTVRPGTTGSPTAPGDGRLAALAREIPEEVRLRFSALRYAEYGALVEKLRKLGWRAPVEDLVVAGLAALAAEGRVPGRRGAAIGAGPDPARPSASDSSRDSTPDSAPGSPSDSTSDSASESALGSPAGPEPDPTLGSVPGSAPGSSSDSAQASTADTGRDEAAKKPRTRAITERAEMRTRVFTGRESPKAAGPADADTRALIDVKSKGPTGLEGGRMREVRTRVFTDTPYQVVVRQCGTCGKSEVVTGRGPKPLHPAELQAVLCDARIHRPGKRNRAAIPPARRREVLERDAYRCRVPGCGSARFLSVHHVEPRAAGGSNAPGNLVTLCASCHRAIHEMADRTGGHSVSRLVGESTARANPGQPLTTDR